jgi:hypothetical protein
VSFAVGYFKNSVCLSGECLEIAVVFVQHRWVAELIADVHTWRGKQIHVWMDGLIDCTVQTAHGCG